MTQEDFDHLPLTDSWLTDAGMVPGRMPGDLVIPPIVRGIDKNHNEYWVVRTYPIPDEARPRTRADFKALCRCLGVKIKTIPCPD